MSRFTRRSRRAIRTAPNPPWRNTCASLRQPSGASEDPPKQDRRKADTGFRLKILGNQRNPSKGRWLANATLLASANAQAPLLCVLRQSAADEKPPPLAFVHDMFSSASV